MTHHQLAEIEERYQSALKLLESERARVAALEALGDKDSAERAALLLVAIENSLAALRASLDAERRKHGVTA